MEEDMLDIRFNRNILYCKYNIQSSMLVNVDI